MRKLLFLICLALFINFLLSGCQNSSKTSSANYSDVEALVEDAKSRIKELPLSEFEALQESEEYFVLLDVRSKDEHNQGYIPGSVLIPRGSLEFKVSNEAFWDNEGLYLPEKTDKLVLYCKSGKRSALAADALQKLGFENVIALAGGFNAWKAAYPSEVEVNLPPITSQGSTPVTVEEDAGGC